MALLAERVTLAFTTFPSFAQWLWVGVITALYGYAALWILARTALFKRSKTAVPLPKMLLLALIAIFTPSLVEELVYRVLFLPHPSEAVPLQIQLGWTLISLMLYVAAHPLLAWTLWHWSRRMFYRPAFLIIVTLLGIACSLAYLTTGSLYAPLFIHWLTIVVWKAFYGGPDFKIGR